MYASNPKSRIARELFYILGALREHYIALMRLNEDTTVRFSKLLVLLSVYMLREEGINKFQPSLVAEQIQGVVARSSVYKYVKQLFEEGILEEEYGDYTCLARTPKFLLNPEELYGKPLTKVKDKDYELDDRIEKIVAKMIQKQIPPVPQGTSYSPRYSAIPVHDSGRLTQKEEFKEPSATVEEIQEKIRKNTKKKPEDTSVTKEEEEDNEVEKEYESFFL